MEINYDAGNVSKKIVLDKKKLPTISVCMIVRNNSKELQNLLPQISKAVDEIVIVDTGSLDNTVAIAKQYTDKVIDNVYFDKLEYQYKGKTYTVISDFSKARNESLKHATKDYILWLDADDMISKQDIARIRFHLMSKPNTAAFLIVMDKRSDREFQLLQLRIVPNHLGIKFDGRIHEQLSPSVVENKIPYSHCDVTIYHLGYGNNDDILRKLARNEMLLKEEVKERPDSFMVNLNLSKSLTGSGLYEEAEKYVDKAIKLVKDGIKMDSESVFLALLTKATILRFTGRTEESIKVLESERERLGKNDVFNLTVGDLYFQIGDYENSYRNLKILTKGSLSVSSIPIDMKNLVGMLMEYLLVASLYVGDLVTAEYCIKFVYKIPNFRIGKCNA